MRIEAVELRQIEIPMVEPLAAAYGAFDSRQAIVVHVVTDIGEGWGECNALNEPTYSPEWSDGEYVLLREILVPALMAVSEVTPKEVGSLLAPYQLHHSAKSAIELAVLDAQLRADNVSLADYWDAAERRIECAIVVGLFEGEALVRLVRRHLERGYRQLKLKIAPGRDVDRIDLLRAEFPDLTLRVDANGSYDWELPEHRKLLSAIDERGLALIEQPLRVDHMRHYVELRNTLKTPIALDESITSWDRAMDAIELHACDAIVLKPGLVGGYLTARQLHEECQARGVATMVGGMIDTCIGRSANLALAALPATARFPAEIAPDGRWFFDRLNVDPVEMHDGLIDVPSGPGIGVDLDFPTLDRLTRRIHVARRGS